MRNRYQRIEKGRRLREEGSELKNRCHACGQPKRGHICSAKVKGGPQVDLPGVPFLPDLSEEDGVGPSSALVSVPLDPSPGGPPIQPPLRRTRSGSKLISDEERAAFHAARGGVQFAVDVPAATNEVHAAMGGVGASSSHAPPHLARNNTSFFRGLVDSDIFSPTSRDFVQGWVDSPSELR